MTTKRRTWKSILLGVLTLQAVALAGCGGMGGGPGLGVGGGGGMGGPLSGPIFGGLAGGAGGS